MKKLLHPLLLSSALIAASPALADPADLVLYNGKVVTVDKDFTIASTIVVKDGKILAVGGPELVKRYDKARKIDLHGRPVLPGFIDTHLHVYGKSHRQVAPDEAKSIKDIQAMVAAKAAELGKGEWITGYGWDEALLTALLQTWGTAARRHPVGGLGSIGEMLIEHNHGFGQGRGSNSECSFNQAHLPHDTWLQAPCLGLSFA